MNESFPNWPVDAQIGARVLAKPIAALGSGDEASALVTLLLGSSIAPGRRKRWYRASQSRAPTLLHAFEMKGVGFPVRAALPDTSIRSYRRIRM